MFIVIPITKMSQSCGTFCVSWCKLEIQLLSEFTHLGDGLVDLALTQPQGFRNVQGLHAYDEIAQIENAQVNT